MNALKRATQRNLEQERIVSGQIDRLQTEGQALDEKIRQLERENQQLGAEVERLETEKDFKVKEKAMQDNKRLYALKSSEYALKEKQELESKLNGQNQQLEQDYNELNAKLQGSLTDREDRQSVTEEIIKVDQENQALREKISSLQEKVKSLK